MRKLARYPIALVMFLAAAEICSSQSFYSDAKGKSSFLLDSGYLLSINTSDSLFGFTVLRDVSGVPSERGFWSVSFTGKPTSDKASLFNGQSLSVDAAMSLSYGLYLNKSMPTPPNYDKLGHIMRKQYKKVKTLTSEVNDAKTTSEAARTQLLLAQSCGSLNQSQLAELKTKSDDESMKYELKKAELESAAAVLKLGEAVQDEPSHSHDELSKKDTEYSKKQEKLAQIQPDSDFEKDSIEQQQELYTIARGIIHDKLSIISKSTGLDKAFVTVTARHAKYKFIDTSLSESDQLFDKNFSGYGISANYNRVYKNSFLGLSVGYLRDNNISDLKQVSVVERTPIGSGDSLRYIEKVTQAFQGDFAVKNLTPFMADYVFWPNGNQSQLAIALNARVSLDHTSDSFVPSLGVFWCKKDAPMNVRGGVILSFINSNPLVSIVSGYKF